MGFNWKMLFNPDPSKPAQEVVFSRKKKEQSHPGISLNNMQVERMSYLKHLRLILDEKLNFKQHIDGALLKMKKGISVIKKIKVFLATKIFAYNLQSLFATPNRLWRYHLRPTSITGAIQGTSRAKLYQELGLESLKSRR